MSNRCRLRLGVWVVAWAMLMTVSSAFAQSTSTFNGRVLDQNDAVLPGATVTAANTATGVTRTSVTNSEGAYLIPGLELGIYNVTTELQGFAPSTRQRVTLGLNVTLTLDFKLALAGIAEVLTVTGDAPLIEVSHSQVASTIDTTELQSLPMITRQITGMLALLPGAAAIEPVHRTKANVGGVAFGGGEGANMVPSVDGADNKDYHYGGGMMPFTTEGLEQFQLSTSQFSAVDGRAGGASVSMVTKSGTNAFRGTGFVFARDRKFAAKDFFTAEAGGEKVPFSRQQFGGSFGGPIVRNSIFFFGAAEQINEDKSLPVPDRLFNELELLLNAERNRLIPTGMVNPNHPRATAIPAEMTMYTFKSNARINNSHSIMGRFAGARDIRYDNVAEVNNDKREPDDSIITMWGAVGQHNWVLGNRGLNQITAQLSHSDWISSVESAITGAHYTRDFPNVAVFPPGLRFPSVTTGRGDTGGAKYDRQVIQLKDDVSLLQGNQSLRFGGSYNLYKGLGVTTLDSHFPLLFFFDDPSVILSNSNGRYPQGFQTPGAVRQWVQANPTNWADSVTDMPEIQFWFQDDWRATSRMTLNLGVRYDRDFNYYDGEFNHQNATRLLLEQIGHEYAGIPKNPTKNISPRVGFAYDLRGNGQSVLRGGYGLYFDSYYTSGAGNLTAQNRRPLNAQATRTNTAVGVGQLATYRFGIDPVPDPPTGQFELAAGSTGNWMANMEDPQTHHFHVGYAQQLGSSTSLTVDYTRMEGRKGLRTLNANPIVNGQRVLAPEFLRVFGVANRLNAINIQTSINESQYDALMFRYLQRIPNANLQVHYTIAKAEAFGANFGARGSAAGPMNAFEPFNPSEWGPTGNDERHRVVAMGVFEAPFGIQLSPIFQAASARPYNLTAGRDLNADGTNNDRWVDPATGQQVSINAARGKATVSFDLRTTKFFALGGARQVGLFVEAFNLFNRANFGSSFTGNASSSNFRLPAGGYVPGVNPGREAQFGARFLF